jgi:hypothetical protein
MLRLTAKTGGNHSQFGASAILASNRGQANIESCNKLAVSWHEAVEFRTAATPVGSLGADAASFAENANF